LLCVWANRRTGGEPHARWEERQRLSPEEYRLGLYFDFLVKSISVSHYPKPRFRVGFANPISCVVSLNTFCFFYKPHIDSLLLTFLLWPPTLTFLVVIAGYSCQTIYCLAPRLVHANSPDLMPKVLERFGHILFMIQSIIAISVFLFASQEEKFPWAGWVTSG
jgi:hypothetical protein